MAEQTGQESVAEIWRLFKETDAKFKETDAKFKETDAKFKETDAKFKETDAKFKETQVELDKRFKATDQKINQLSGLFGSQWGKFIETLVQPNALNLFRQRNIGVNYTFPRAKSNLNGRSMEIDLLLENSNEVVAVEVKSTLRVQDVIDFLADLAELTTFFPRFKNYRIYGGVAGLDIVEEADRYAYRQGLFVLSLVGDGVVQIKNDANFKPKNFGA